jgi:pimeloyl-ACP methyl ester carboxylesterase
LPPPGLIPKHGWTNFELVLCRGHFEVEMTEAGSLHVDYHVAGLRISSLRAEGAKHPVLLLHGNSSCNLIWSHQLRALQRHGYPLLAPDLPGHGLSRNAPDPNIYSFPGYASVVQGLLDALNWTSIDVIGWSLGGHIALELLAADDRIRSTMIIGTPPARPCPESLENAFYASSKMQLAGKPCFSAADAEEYGKAMLGGEKHLTEPLLANIQRADGRARMHMFQSALSGVGVDQRVLVETSDKPLCVVHGEAEPFVRLSYLQSVRYQALWRNRIQIVPKAGHAPHWQRPRSFNRILLW